MSNISSETLQQESSDMSTRTQVFIINELQTRLLNNQLSSFPDILLSKHGDVIIPILLMEKTKGIQISQGCQNNVY